MDLSKFFPGLGGALPPTNPVAVGAPAAAAAAALAPPALPPPQQPQQQQQQQQRATPSPPPQPQQANGAWVSPDLATQATSTVVLEEPPEAATLPTMAIAKYPTPRPQQPTGTLLTMSDSFIVYAVKQGMVRVIHTRTAARTLLKGHAQPVVDVSVSEDPAAPVALLLTCAQDATCILWEVSKDALTAEGEIVSSESLRLRAPPNHGMQRAFFHPQNSRLVFVAHGPNVTCVTLSGVLWEAARQAGPGGIDISQAPGQLRLWRAHAGNVTDVAFSLDGRVATGGEDGVAVVWALPPGVVESGVRSDADLAPIMRVSCAPNPVRMVGFVGARESTLVCGAGNALDLSFFTLAAAAAPPKVVRFTAARAGATITNRASPVVRLPSGDSVVVVADMNSPVVAMVSVDAQGFARLAQVVRVSAPLLSVSAVASTAAGPPALSVHALDAGMVQSYTASLARVMAFPVDVPGLSASSEAPPVPSPRAAVVAPAPVAAAVPATVPVPAPTPAPLIPPAAAAAVYATPTTMSTTTRSVPGATTPITADNSMDALFARLDARAEARDAVERERQKRLLDVMGKSFASISSDVEEAVGAKLADPAFVAGLTAQMRGELSTEVGKAVDRAMAKAMPQLIEKVTETVAARVQANMQRAFEENFRAHLVPAFEAGCRDMVTQFTTFLPTLAASSSSAQANPLATLGFVPGAAAVAPPDPRVLVAAHLQANRVDEALQLAASRSDVDPDILASTCRDADLTSLLRTAPPGVNNATLAVLLRALSRDVMSDPTTKLDWINDVALAMNPADAHAPDAARDARTVLAGFSGAFQRPHPLASKFLALQHILGSIASG